MSNATTLLVRDVWIYLARSDGWQMKMETEQATTSIRSIRKAKSD